jgi:superfamily II DNA helicase RecQ
MKSLGLDKYVAGLHKDEMAASYKVSKPEPDTVLQDLCDVNEQLLRETLRSCQLGSEQRMTDPQACRISSFWHDADPEGNARSFRRNLKQDTVEGYLAHWTQMLTFCWRGWQGNLFQGSLKDLARRTISKDRISDSEDGKGSDDDPDSGPSSSSSSSSSSSYRTGSADKTLYERYFRLTDRQRSCLANFAKKVDGYDDSTTTTSSDGSSGTDSDEDDREQRLAALRGPAIALARAIIQQHLAGSPFDSPLIAYVAMLSVNRFGSWEEPGSYNSHLSALVYCGQLWIFRFACEQADRQRSSPCVEKGQDQESDNDGLDEELDSQMRQYFVNTVSKPLSYILLWRRRLFSIAPITMVNRHAAWDLTKTTVTYRGHSISMDQVRLMCRKTIDRARYTLYSKLMFDVEHLPKLTPKDLQENDSERTPGWWFGKHSQNATILHGHKEALAEHVASTARLREMYMEERCGPAGQTTLMWRKNTISLYRELVQDFLRDIAPVTHLGSGPPVRAPEFMSPMWRNTERLRHIQLRYGKVVLHLVEHKMMSTTGKPVNNIRFLCDELGELLVNYLVYVVPLLESMAWYDGSKSPADAFLWVDADGKRWPETRFSDILKAACKRAEVPEVGTMVWRQMSSAIINTHFDDAVDRSCLAAVALGAEESSRDIDEDGRDSLAASLVSMSNHSLRTHRMSYANDSPFANVWDGMLVKSHRASVAWAKFFGLDRGADEPERTDAAIATSSPSSPPSSQHGRKRGISATSGSEVVSDVARKIQNVGGSQNKRHWSGTALLAEARKLYRNDKLGWRCPEQEQALRLVANRAPEVLLILATGSGKSLTFMLGSSLPGSRTTIVIVPLVLLRLDLVRRCRLMNIEPVLWKSSKDVAVGMDSGPALLFVSVEVAIGPGFRQYARRLYDTGNLERFVFDECHLIQTSAHYRKSMARLSMLRELPVPFVYMTATLPPRLEAVLCQRHHMGRVSVVRGCSKRPNISYNVEHVHPPPGEAFLPHVCSIVRERWDSAPTSEWKAPRVMVFLRSCNSAEEAAEQLGCEFYHREIGSVKEKEDRLARWISGESGSPFLACTTAAGPGVDYPHVRWVVHIEDPYGLIDYAQESGRAGRDEEPAGATVFMKRDPKQGAPPTPLDHPDPADDQALKDYLGGADCRRLSFARDLDQPQHWKSCEIGDDVCDVCKKEQQIEVGDSNSNNVEVQREDRREDDEEVHSNSKKERQEEEQYHTLTNEETEVTLEKEGGVIRLRRQQMEEQHQIDEYLLRLSIVRDTCMLCRILTPRARWEHKMDDCPQQHKWDYIRSKQMVVQGRKGAKRWLPGYAACYLCGQPQDICRQWDKGQRRDVVKGCKYRDLVMPAIWGLWTAGGFDREWIKGRLVVQVNDEKEALIAAGRVIEFGGRQCVLGIQVFAALLERWEVGVL